MNHKYKFRNIPENFKKCLQIVNWEYRENPSNPDKPKKVPINPNTGKEASVKEAKTWSAFKVAEKRYKKGGVDGVGFVFTKDDPFVGIDLDNCRNPKNGKIKSWAKEIINSFGSYSEVSPSGTGVHIIVKGKLPGKGKKVGDIEMYDQRRYFTVTGNHMADTPSTIKKRIEQINKLYASLSVSTKEAPAKKTSTKRDSFNDVEVIAKILQADTKGIFLKLLSGDDSNHASPSEADLAFCSYVSGITKSPDSIDRIFRSSKLMRQKWDEDHGGKTYGELTISKVLKNPRASFGKALNEKATDYDIAKATIKYFERKNIYALAGKIWRWRQKKGVWEIIDDAVVKKRILRIAHEKSISHSRVNSIFGLINTEIFSTRSRFDKCDKHVINCKNGELHFNSKNGDFVLKPHNRDSNFCHQIPVCYDDTATCKRFEQALQESFAPDDDCREKIKLLQEFFGYALITSCEFERFLLLVGSGSNGKSVIIELLTALVGEQNVSSVLPNQFERLPQLAHLHGKLANIITEIPEGAVIADAKLKSITSGESMTAEHKFGHPFDFKPYSTLIFSANHLPHTKDCSPAFFRRVEILTFNVSFTGDECDTTLKDELPKELSGVLNFALKGLKRLFKKRDFTQVPSSKAAKREWELAADQVSAFIEEECELNPSAKILIGDLYDKYKDWATESGIKSNVNKPNLTSRLKLKGCKPTRGSGGVRMLSGIRLRAV